MLWMMELIPQWIGVTKKSPLLRGEDVYLCEEEKICTCVKRRRCVLVRRGEDVYLCEEEKVYT